MNYPEIKRKERADKRANDEKRFCSEDLMDYYNDTLNRLYDTIIQAKNEAIKRGIKANMIAITDKLFFTRLQYHFQDIPMILGMKCMYTSELPDDVLFSIFDSPNPPLNAIEENEALKKENKKLKDMLRRIAEFADGSEYHEGADEFDL